MKNKGVRKRLQNKRQIDKCRHSWMNTWTQNELTIVTHNKLK